MSEELVIRSEVEPGPYGFAPEARPASTYLNYGVINLDKPRGPSSHTVTSWIRSILEFSGKIGHSGTLESLKRRGKSQGQWSSSHTAGEGNEGNDAAL